MKLSTALLRTWTQFLPPETTTTSSAAGPIGLPVRPVASGLPDQGAVELVRALRGSNGPEADGIKEQLLGAISDLNQKTEALLAELAVLCVEARINKDDALAALSKELVLAHDVLPKMAETVANINRPRMGGSYRQLRASYWAIARHTKYNPNVIARKHDARLFAIKLGLRVPALYQEGVSHSDIVIEAPCVIKPLSEDGGVGVHAIEFRDGKFVDLFNKKQEYKTESDLKAHFADLLVRKKVRSDAWIVEELILPPSGRLEDSRDLKFFAFYGKTGYVLQVDRWSKAKPVRAMFTTAGKAVNASKFYNIPKDPFEPVFTEEDIALVADVSSKIPWPGLRIDFLNGKDGLVFGEFTVNPGAYGGFATESDQFLGGLWASAAGAIFDDLLRGKQFAEYFDYLSERNAASIL